MFPFFELPVDIRHVIYRKARFAMLRDRISEHLEKPKYIISKVIGSSKKNVVIYRYHSFKIALDKYLSVEHYIDCAHKITHDWIGTNIVDMSRLLVTLTVLNDRVQLNLLMGESTQTNVTRPNTNLEKPCISTLTNWVRTIHRVNT